MSEAAVGAGASARRAIWGLLDQGLSSLINFGVGFLIARSVSEVAFGAFSVAFATYIVTLVATRALASEPFLIRHSHQPVRHWRVAVAGATGVALLLGSAAGAIVVVLGGVVGGLLAEALLPLGLAFPGLLLLDTLRFAFVARGRPAGAFACDLAWVVLLLPTLGGLQASGAMSVGPAIMTWGITALLVSVIAMAAAHTAPSLRSAVGWWRRHRDIGGRYVVEGLLSLAASQTTIVVLGAIVGLAAAGGLRGAQLLIGPIQVVLIGLTIVAIPEGVQILARSGRRGLVTAAILVSGVVSTVAIGYALVLAGMPGEMGAMILGDTWDRASPVLFLMGMAYAGATAGLGAGIGLRVLADARRSLRVRALDAIAQSAGGITGALLGGAPGAAAGLLVGAWIGATGSWWQFRAAIRAAGPGDPSTGVSRAGDGRWKRLTGAMVAAPPGCAGGEEASDGQASRDGSESIPAVGTAGRQRSDPDHGGESGR